MESPETLLALILDGVPQPVWVVDEQGVIVFANPAAVSALGYDDPARLRGRRSHQTVHYLRPDGSPLPESECLMLRPRQTGETVHSDDDWLVRQDGSMMPIAWWSAPIDMPSGRGAVLAFTDITERRAAEQAVRERDAARIRAAESRAAGRRILDSATSARRQLARDLHDGAQQRLVALLIALRAAREESSGHVTELVDEAIGQARAAIDELRELAAGIHPSILSTRGLGAAIEGLAAVAALPVVVDAAVDRALPEIVEANAYFFVAEALTNAVKHSRASRVDVTIRTGADRLTIDVRDDGGGGARVGDGSGLVGLADRIAALDGTFAIESPPDHGTVVHAEIPL